MYILGHVGLTLAAARALDRDADLRWAAFLAVAPDLLDKPVARLAPSLVNHSTRAFGHTLLASAAVFLALLLWKRRPKPALLLWGCYAGHFVLDAMWTGHNPPILLWPLLGGFPPPTRGQFFSGVMLWNVLGEAAGLALLVRLFRQRGSPGRLAKRA